MRLLTTREYQRLWGQGITFCGLVVVLLGHTSVTYAGDSSTWRHMANDKRLSALPCWARVRQVRTRPRCTRGKIRMWLWSRQPQGVAQRYPRLQPADAGAHDAALLHRALVPGREHSAHRRWKFADVGTVLRTERLAPNRTAPLYTPLPC